jgi:enoyl-CoA hydratase
MSLVLLDSDGPVRLLTLNAPERRNALDWALLDELAAAVAAVADDPDARALVVTGAGKGFCAGANLANLFGDLDRPTEQMRDHLMKVYASFLGIRDLTIPTIAAVNGAAIGAGMNVALACDVIVAGPRSKSRIPVTPRVLSLMLSGRLRSSLRANGSIGSGV